MRTIAERPIRAVGETEIHTEPLDRLAHGHMRFCLIPRLTI